MTRPEFDQEKIPNINNIEVQYADKPAVDIKVAISTFDDPRHDAELFGSEVSNDPDSQQTPAANFRNGKDNRTGDPKETSKWDSLPKPAKRLITVGGIALAIGAYGAAGTSDYKAEHDAIKNNPANTVDKLK